MSAPVVAVRRVLQPGRPRAERVTAAVAPRPRRAALRLPGGQSFYEALTRAFARCGVRAGAFVLLGGPLSAAAYHVAVPSPKTARAAEYGPPIDLGGEAALVRATGSYGEDLSGNPLLHIHGVLADSTGRAHGGHIAPERCVIGPPGMRAVLLLSVGFRQAVDPETGYALFFPHAEVATDVPVNPARDHHGPGGQRADRA